MLVTGGVRNNMPKKLSVSRPSAQRKQTVGKVYNNKPALKVTRSSGMQRTVDPAKAASSWTNRNYKKKR